MDHMIQVGRIFDAEDLIEVNQAHIMDDPEAVGVAGVELLETFAKGGARVSIPKITDLRGVNVDYYYLLGQREEMAQLEARLMRSMTDLGILMANTCINYQAIIPPVRGERTDAKRMDIVDTFEATGGKVLVGTCFYNGFAREIREANNWWRLLSTSAKIVNNLGGYGYQAALKSMENCIASAVAGEIV